ncbi:pilus assembly protein FimV [Shewanella sp. Choline-02u-19]|uniref:FimV/HubP family polar landmark protein n=1 Tax=unclassified Shewanella TaxID=196818 RepID=UPI000C31C733|nr:MULTISPECIES: FimV/HubP family polar landmark protein [unclassified Shewanella]PKH56488.1 pilus assembly protein FimV [Shewanella sp. Bg11-22]PKI28006.1 pilus assembly protein FimV [Shewanella sp. Choline-02u-19]
MNFRTSHLVGIFAVVLTVLTIGPSINFAVAESLKITGPEGQVQSVKRQYGPTTSSDTFWSIAQAVKPDNSVTVYQVMSALFDANPHAFSGKNYNSLERGMILLVPSKDVMQQVSTTDAKKRAEYNDRGWLSTAQTKEKPTESIVKQRVTPAVKPTAKPVIKAIKTPTEIKSLSDKLEQAEALNLALTDELARATDEITISSTDTESFQEKISELKAENALLKQALQDKNLENDALKSDVTAKQEKIDLLSQEKEQPTSTLWRSLMDNPLLLIFGAVVPALLMLGIFWMFIRRRNDSDTPLEANPETSDADVLTENAASDEASDTDDSLAIHLDSEQAENSVDSMDEIEQPKLNDSAEFVVEEAADEGQSLDDLWAEAMGEQDGEVEALDSLEQPSAENEDDLDALLAGFDEEPKTVEIAKEDDLDALLAGFDEDTKSEPIADEDDLDVLLAGFDEDTKSEPIADEDDLDVLLAGFDEETKSESIADEDALDALLAGFDEDSTNEALNREPELDELDLLLAANSPAIKEDVTPNDDLDSLLAEFDITADEQDTLANDSDIDALSDEIAAELELPLEIAAELDLGVDDISVNEADLDNELDALLADLDAPVDEHAIQLPQESKALVDDIAAELATEVPEQPVEEGELDSLLAEFNLSATSADNVLSELHSSEETKSVMTEAADVDFSLDFDTSALDGTELAEFKNNVETDVDSSIDLKIDVDEQPEAADNMLEFTSTPIEPSVKVEKDSGFFDDLKGTKKAEPAALDWDAASAELTNSTLTDDELLSALAATGASAVEGEDEEDINSFIIEDDSKLTVDQALAALDANEGSISASHIPEHDLTSFQKDNGFIDIDRLLNEADEDSVETDLYKELDVDMGELDTFMGNISMVDVDDAENSINAKLDLARAYIEIDDNDSAHALLKEVELDGNERQQEEAAGLIKELV